MKSSTSLYFTMQLDLFSKIDNCSQFAGSGVDVERTMWDGQVLEEDRTGGLVLGRIGKWVKF